MRILKELSLFLIIFIYLALGIIFHFLITFIQPNLRYRIISKWTKIINVFLRKILGIRLIIEGKTQYLKERYNFIISNHLSYLDGVILGSLFPVVFVSKLAVKSWPIFGWMTQISGTIFIDRKRKLKSVSSIEEIAGMLKKGVNVLLFPEGTSTDGTRLLPFQSVFFQAPINSGSAIIPITIQYTKINSCNVSLLNRDKVCWYGQVKFFKHLLDVLRLRDIEAKVTIHPKIETGSGLNPPDSRKHLSQISREAILKNFSFIK